MNASNQIASHIVMFCLQMTKCIALDEKLKDMDREIAVNPQYVQKVCNFQIQSWQCSDIAVRGN